jgi:hypothetical protein
MSVRYPTEGEGFILNEINLSSSHGSVLTPPSFCLAASRRCVR